MLKYVMLGMGYISGKHLDAIKQTGGELIAYHDIHDVVGHVDSRFIHAKYYPEMIHLDCFVDRYQRQGHIDYCVICLPNHLHNPAIRWALNHDMDVIVEKPIVLHERNLDELSEVERRTGKKVNTILQMRLHEETARMKQMEYRSCHSVNINYSSPRGSWFHHGSWKADPLKTGGLVSAIGIHLLDLCCHVFGDWQNFEVESYGIDRAKAWTDFERASVHWCLSVEPKKGTNRTFSVDGIDFDYTKGFTELHTESYRQIINGNGFGIEDARNSIKLAEAIRWAK